MTSYLVTGGVGYFGRQFVSHLLDHQISDRICVFSRSEHAQAQMRDELNDDPRMRWFIGDVRDRDRLRRAMTGVDVVIHAAALKRIEVGISNPIEMIRTNVDGSINVIEAAQDAGVRKAIYLSTDKAWRPVSVYGQTKALAESMFLAANNTVPVNRPRFVVTRYGNIFGSCGSVVPRWKAMIDAGATSVPVTDPDCTRFFMTVEQAVALVLQGIAGDDPGPLIPDLPAYRLADLAEAMCVQMDIRGLPSWEKKHEGMSDGLTSDLAPRMTVAELKEALARLHE